MTLEEMVSDTIEVTHYLRNRFGKEKIYIMGNSWGSLLGVITVKQQPEFFHAYIGIGQVAQQERSERLAYTYMLENSASQTTKKDTTIKKISNLNWWRHQFKISCWSAERRHE